MDHLKRVWSLLSPAERRELVLLLPGIVFTGLLQIVGVASLMPFLGLVADPSRVERHALLSRAIDSGIVTNRTELLIGLGAIVLLLLVVGNAAAAFSTWSTLRFSWLRNHTISLRLLSAYAAQPWAWFLSRNSSDLTKNVLSEVQQVVSGILVQGVQMLARLVVSAFLLAAIVVVEPLLALVVFSVLAGAYGGIYLVIRRRINALGRNRSADNAQRFRLTSELLGGMKDVKFYGMEREVVERFVPSSERYAAAMASSTSLAQVPRYALEVVAFGGVLLIVLYLLVTNKPTAEAFPLIGVYAFAAYRLLPALQVAFAAMTTIRFNGAALNNICAQFEGLAPAAALGHNDNDNDNDQVVPLTLRGVGFSYPGSESPVLHDIDLDIARGDWVAFVGTTGSGKSTLCDLVLGLLEPDRGTISLVGQPFTASTARRWRRHVGYVPQQIFLVDDTIERNIAFGSREPLDHDRVVAAARAAQIAGFIEEQPDGYRGVVGERGVRLSGGQRQRLGIARALYAHPAMLVLDEATSALDNETERTLFEHLRREHRHTTVVMVAHRLSTVRDCDCICVMERGRIVARGRYDDLLATSPAFRALAGELATEVAP